MTRPAMTVQEYHDRMLEQARELVAQGHSAEAAIAMAHRRVQTERAHQPAAVSSVVAQAMQLMIGEQTPPAER